MKESATLRNIKIIEDRKQKGLPIYNAGLGENPLPVPKELEKELQKFAWDKHYKTPDGIPELQEAICKYYNDGFYKVNSIIVGNGLKELLFIIQLCFEGSIILIAPYWVSYREHASILKKDMHVYHTKFENDYKIDPLELDIFLQDIDGPKMLIFNNPCNPTGAVYNPDDIKALVPIFRKHNIVVFEDEIYINLVHNGYQTDSLAKYYPERTIKGNSISKQYGCGGFRLGWLTFPKELEDLSNIIYNHSSSIYSCGSAPMQHVAVKALNSSPYLKKFVDDSATLFGKVGKTCYDIITTNTKIKCSKPMGAWYLFLDFSEYKGDFIRNNIHNDKELCARLLEDIGLVTVAGKSFGSNKTYCLRYSYIEIDKELNYDHMMVGLYKLVDWLRKL
jgi:aspartate/methionine/tyrosine aminotransferase